MVGKLGDIKNMFVQRDPANPIDDAFRFETKQIIV
jgi:hypothetical protein